MSQTKLRSDQTSAWDLVIDEDGSSFANWVGATGTWSSDGSVIQQTSTSTQSNRASHNTKIDAAEFVVACEAYMFSSGAVISFGAWDRVNDGYALVASLRVSGGTHQVTLDNENNDIRASVNYAWPYDTWISLKIHYVGNRVTVWIGGVLVVTGHADHGMTYNPYFEINTNTASAKFRNIKVWTKSLPS